MRVPRCRAPWCGPLLAASLWVTPLHADLMPAQARAEIGALLSKLAASGCQFKRNGSWHSAAEARMHLQRKVDYLAEKGRLNNAEQFIELAATRSSMSGRAYWVQCGDQAAVPSGTWLASHLRALRAQSERVQSDGSR